MEQYSPEWYAARLGKFTSSGIAALMSDPKSKAAKDAGELSESAMSYVLEKIGEIVSGQPASSFVNTATAWGDEHEPAARKWYAKLIAPIEEAGFITYPFLPYYGGSPDGLVAIDGVPGGVEIKCPYVSANHLQHCLITDVAYFKQYFKEYYWQCVSNMVVTGSEFWDFVSFDPRLDSDCGMFRFRIGMKDVEEDGARLVARVVQARFVMHEVAAKLGVTINEELKSLDEITSAA